MDRKNQLIDLLNKSQQSELRFISELSDEEREMNGTSQDWAVKDEIVHLAAWKGIMAERFIAAREDKSPPDYDDWDAVNEELFQRHKELTWQEVLEFQELSYQRLAEQIELISVDNLMDKQRYGWLNGHSLWNRAIHNGYFHPHWHLALLYSKRGEIERGSQLMEEVTRTLLTLDESPRWQGQAIYNLACFCALSGEKEAAITNLREAIALSPNMIEWSRTDTDLASIREEPDYLALVI